MAAVLLGLSALLGLAFLAMWPSSYGYYTSFGFDVDRAEGAVVTQTHYRLRWPGNGAFFLGRDAFRRPHEGILDPFDLGGAFFRSPRRPPEGSSWNRLGFWFIDQPPAEPTPRAYATAGPLPLWVGVPSWLPALLLLLPPAGWWWRRKAGRSTAVQAGPEGTPP